MLWIPKYRGVASLAFAEALRGWLPRPLVNRVPMCYREADFSPKPGPL